VFTVAPRSAVRGTPQNGRIDPARFLVRLGLVGAGFAVVTAWLGVELVYQVRVTLDDDGGVVPYFPAGADDGSAAG
jgi:hypothetical protein